MRSKCVQMSLLEAYTDVRSVMDENKPEFLALLEEHINFDELIPVVFRWAFYRWTGRPREYSLEGFIKFCVLQKILGIEKDSTLLTLMRMCSELREFCGFDKAPDASKITRFKQDFVAYIQMVFENLVCYAHKAGMLTNGLGIVRRISFFDEDFRRKHPEVGFQKDGQPGTRQGNRRFCFA